MYPQNCQSGETGNRIEERSSREWDLAAAAMLTRKRSPRAQHAQHAPAQPAAARADASPGLLRRRYSVPETVMRKYRLTQQSSDTESESGGCLSAGGAAGEAPRPPRRDRELMRKSALLRRMWARAPPPAACACACDARSLPASRDELRASCVLSSCPDTACAPSEASAPAPASPEESAASAGHAPFSSERLVCDGAAPYELLEIVVSESASSSPPERGAGSTPPTCPAPPRPAPTPLLDIDEYVSRVLVESLNSLTDRLEGMNASVGADRKLSVVEKEIKVRLQNAAVNTIVHLSPTSNHQIIFGNEELCGRAAPAPPVPPAEVGDAVDQQEGVNRAVLRQIQQLFREELRLEEGAGVSLVEVAPLSAVGAGNYYRPLQRAALVPRRTALPHSASMEVNTSEDSDAGLDALASDAASLVDSLEDPLSPRLAALRRAPAAPATPATPPTPPTPAPPEAFFVPIRDDVTPEGARVAEYMPERIRQRLHRRQRTRELRLESARRGRVRRLQEELQARRRERAERDARAALDALLDDVVAELTRAEARAARRDPPASTRRRERSRPEPSAPAQRPPRRIYQKSEIHRGDNCIEILEILEYSRSSSDGAPAEERARTRRSRIPVPVPDHMRLTGGDASPLARLLLRALAPSAPAPAPAPRDRSNSLRFRGIFDMIPEERASLSLESSADAEEADGGRRASAPALAPAPTRSAGTSPPAAARRSQTTMTSPGSRSAATSPWRAPPPPPPREGIVCACRPPAPLHRTASLAVE